MEKSQKNKLKSFYDKLNNTQVTFSFDPEKLLSGKKLYVFAFFITVIMLFAGYMLVGIYPAGNKSVLSFDLYHLFVHQYENFRDAFWGGRSLFNSWSRNLSGETFGSYASNIANPFMWIILIMPRSMITEAILIMQLLKAGTTSVTFSIYLRHSRKMPSCTSLMFSLMYSLMTFIVVQLLNPSWIDGIILLPLICWGIERLIDDGKLLGFIIPLAVMYIESYYIGWMITIFSCLYFLAYYCFISDSRLPLKVMEIVRCGLKFALSGILAAMCASCVLIPSYFSISVGKLGMSEAFPDSQKNFDLIDFFVNLLPNTFDTLARGGSPLVYCGILTLLLVPLYFFSRSVPFRKKLGYGILAAIIILSMYVYSLDLVWHGFQPPYGVPYRYAFLLSFVLLLIAVQAFENIEGIDFGKIGLTFFFLLGYVIYAEKFTSPVTAQGGKVYIKISLFSVTLFTIIMLSAYALLLYFHKKFYKVKPVPVVIAVFLLGELFFTSSITLQMVDKNMTYAERNVYYSYVDLGRDTISKIHDMDDGLYRVEKNFRQMVSDNMSFGAFGISHGSSTSNTGVINFFRKLGFPCDRYFTYYDGSTYVTDSVLGIKYVMESKKNDNGIAFSEAAETDEVISTDDSKNNNGIDPLVDIFRTGVVETGKSVHYDKLVVTNENSGESFYVYENPYALPIAFMADEAIADAKFESWENPFENQNILLSALLSDEKKDFFKSISIDELIAENLAYSRYEGYDRYSVISNDDMAILDFEFTAPTDDMIYAYFPAEGEYMRGVSLWVDNEFIGRCFTDSKSSLVNLGRHDGEKVSFKMSVFNKIEVMFKDAYFYYLDEDMFAKAIEDLKRQPLEIESFREDHIKGMVTAEKDGILFTSIAWEPGWTILVDGKKTEPVKLMDALIGIPVTEGTHSIEMKFFPAGMVWGIVLSVLGIAVVVIIGVFERKKRTGASS